jgi:hypothetical protein
MTDEFKAKSSYASGRYEVLGAIGEGGTARVLHVVDQHLRVERALKVMVITPSTEARERQEREARVLAQLDDPGIVRVFDTFVEDDRQCVVMQLCAESLAARVERDGPLAPDAIVDLGEVLLEALELAHSHGVVHRDVKPHNVLYSQRGRPLLADFGLAWVHEDPQTLSRTGAMLGTVGFMAPEQRRGEPAGESADLYSLAATLAWAATGAHLGDLYSPTTWRRLQRSGLPDSLVGWLARAGREDPAARAGGVGSLRAGQVIPEQSRDAEPALPRPVGLLRRAAGPLLVAALLAAVLVVAPRVAREEARAGLVTDYPGVLVEEAWAALPHCPDLPETVSTARYPTREVQPRGREEASGVEIVDLDGDGHTDLAFSHQLGKGIAIFWGNGKRPFWGDEANPADVRMTWVDSLDLRGLTSGDIDGDGEIDLLAVQTENTGFVVHFGQGARRFSEPVEIFGVGSLKFPRLIDWDSDGVLDLVFLLDGRAMIRTGTGQGSFGKEVALGNSWSQQLSGFDLSTGPILVETTQKRELIIHRPGAEALRPAGRPVLPSYVLSDRPGLGSGFLLWSNASPSVEPLRDLTSVTFRSTRVVGYRLSEAKGWVRCRAEFSLPSRLSGPEVGDVDGDGVLDFVLVQSGGYMTSSYLVAYGSSSVPAGSAAPAKSSRALLQSQ